ncbi:MAG: prepilin-type N-terminal cleavage/methylation domain-containing protein [Opitutaceae bacterium]|nr:prepilin-type N-terminal cleavage/methylation domain-containing protein [Opitutaceae bacterium]
MPKTFPTATHRLSSPSLRPAAASGFTLVEVMVSSMVMVILLGGVLATLIQSRRLTEGSIYQNSTVTIMQGYIEQIKSMEFSQVNISPASTPTIPVTIATVLDQDTPDALTLSVGTPPTSMPAIGVVPTGAVNNLKVVDINNTPTNTKDDLNMTLWIWVQDLTGVSANVSNAKAITLIYTWQFKDGTRTRTYRSSVRTVRSLVPSY